jgi:signal transduction histidine kinase
MGDNIVLLDHDQDKVTWVSSSFAKLFSNVTCDSTIEQTLNCIGLNSESTKTIKHHIINTTGKRDKIEVRCGNYVAVVSKIMSSQTLIRLEPILMSGEEANRYLKDREKLLITSRSLSVSEMASTLAHEINQPIGAINNLLHGIRDRIKGSIDSSIVTAIDKTIEQAEFISRIIGRIRDYTQTNSPDLQKIDLVALINKCISLMDWEIRHTNLTIEQMSNLPSAYTYADELMLQQVVVNLIRNGVESIDSVEKLIEIDITTEGEYYHITIKDNGQGLSDAESENLFMPFVSNKGTGMGIGLNICRSFIELHRGRIWLTQNEGMGCTSHVILPYQ